MNYNVKISIEKEDEVRKEVIPYYAKHDFINKEAVIEALKANAMSETIQNEDFKGFIAAFTEMNIRLINGLTPYSDSYSEEDDKPENVFDRLARKEGYESYEDMVQQNKELFCEGVELE